MRRMSDGVKIVGRWRTVEIVEKKTVFDEREYQFLYNDGEATISWSLPISSS